MSYTKEDFTHDTPPRIMGSETEYTTQTATNDESAMLFASVDASKMLTPSSPDNNTSIWLKNGAHMYQDIGDLHEYATPECSSAEEVLLYEKAGEEIIQAAVLATLPVGRDSVYKRAGYAKVVLEGNVIHKPLSAGHHENYYFPTGLIDHGSIAQQELYAYLSTRIVWAGAGIVDQYGFGLSQKANSVNFATRSSGPEGDKVTSRVHPSVGRLELLVGDGNMSDWAVINKFAMTSLVLRLIEHDKFPAQLLTRQDPTPILRGASRNPSLPFNTSSGLLLTPTAHQRMIAEHALDFAEHKPNIPDEETQAAEEIIQVCNRIEGYLDGHNDLSGVNDRVDWAAKYDHMRQKGLQKADLTTKNLEAVMHDLSWEDISTRGISRRWYERKGTKIAKPDDIERALYVPPVTRAQKRTQIIRDLTKEQMIHFVSWNKVDSDNGMIDMPDPYEV